MSVIRYMNGTAQFMAKQHQGKTTGQSMSSLLRIADDRGRWAVMRDTVWNIVVKGDTTSWDLLSLPYQLPSVVRVHSG